MLQQILFGQTLGGQRGALGRVLGCCPPPHSPALWPHREEVLPKLHSDPDYPCDLVGNWNTWYGEQDQAGEGRQRLLVPLLPKAEILVGFWGAAPLAHPRSLFAVHLWRFSGGYPALMDCMNKLRQNKVPPGWGRDPCARHPRPASPPPPNPRLGLSPGVPGLPQGEEPDAAVPQEPAAPGIQLLE